MSGLAARHDDSAVEPINVTPAAVATRAEEPSWLALQRRQLKAALIAIRGRRTLSVTQPFFEIDRPIDDVVVHYADDKHYRSDPTFSADIYFCQGYAPDRARLRYMRETGRATLLVSWFWDNHHLFADTMHAALLSDVYFAAHGYASGYIRNDLSLDGGFAPLCPIFWRDCDVEQASAAALLGPRSDALYGGYNSYAEFPERDALIERIRAHVPDNNLFVTPHGTSPEAHPFYGLTPVARLLEWMKYKVALCISFGANTAIRIFDALLGGGIPLVVGRPHDLDAIFPRAVQDRLPIVVVDDPDPRAVAAAHRHCIERFDAGGFDAVIRRSRYVREHHMPRNRLTLMVDAVRTLAEAADTVVP